MTNHTAKITVRGRPGEVAAIVAQLKEFFEVVEVGQANRLRIGQQTSQDIQQSIRILAPEVADDDQPSAA